MPSDIYRSPHKKSPEEWTTPILIAIAAGIILAECFGFYTWWKGW